MKNKQIRSLVISALLTALSIVVTTLMPIKVYIEPASFTLFSHVPLMIAMFISPLTTVYAWIGTTLGFFLNGAPFPVVMRAASHLSFALVGALIIKKHPQIIESRKSLLLFGLGISVIHVIAEAIMVVLVMGPTANSLEFLMTFIVGLGFVHSMFDYTCSVFVYKRLKPMIDRFK